MQVSPLERITEKQDSVKDHYTFILLDNVEICNSPFKKGLPKQRVPLKTFTHYLSRLAML